MAQDVIRRIREVTDLPIKHVVLTHYHAVRVLGASAYERRAHRRQPAHLRPDRRARPAGLRVRGRPLPAPVPGRRLRARPDLAEHRLPEGADGPHGQARGAHHAARPRPHQGRHHRLAAEEKVLFSGDLVEYGATPYTGDAYHEYWPPPSTACRHGPQKLVPGRGAALQTPSSARRPSRAPATSSPTCTKASRRPRPPASPSPSATARPTPCSSPKYGHWVIFDHCMPFDVTRCYDEAGGGTRIRASGPPSATPPCGTRCRKWSRTSNALHSQRSRRAAPGTGLGGSDSREGIGSAQGRGSQRPRTGLSPETDRGRRNHAKTYNNPVYPTDAPPSSGPQRAFATARW
jgi:hypothetical protein